ncbi:MAG: hypothetical protein ACI9MF_000702 [Gammaproteobacteria bacterium]|jgi:hypothetical protein
MRHIRCVIVSFEAQDRFCDDISAGYRVNQGSEMWRYKYLRMIPKRMISWQRLGVEYIKSGLCQLTAF